jgi:hypothetical protein
MALRITSIALVAAWMLAVGARSSSADDFWGLSSLMTLPAASHADCDACDDCHGPTRLAGDARGCDNHDCEPLSCGDRFGGGQPHTVTPDGHTEWADNISLSTAGQTFEHTFEAEGEYPYYCHPHRDAGMTGVIRVVAND